MPWKTTPAMASPPPTTADVNMRGMRTSYTITGKRGSIPDRVRSHPMILAQMILKTVPNEIWIYPMPLDTIMATDRISARSIIMMTNDFRECCFAEIVMTSIQNDSPQSFVPRGKVPGFLGQIVKNHSATKAPRRKGMDSQEPLSSCPGAFVAYLVLKVGQNTF